MKKILISLSIIGVVATIATGATIALFNDTETSTGNILVAGTMDLKVDHTWQTYNDIACNTCDLTLISDPTNMVVARNDVSVTAYPAVLVGSNHPSGFNPPNWFHSAWTAQNHPILAAANAKWIWEDDPTDQADIEVDTTYTFRKTFEWYGPVITSDLWFAVGSDNSVEVWLNGEKIAENTGEYGYRLESMLEIPGTVLTNKIDQGENTLEFVIKNFAQPGGNYLTNPAGLIYKFYLSGDCQGTYFKQHCNLWGLKDLEDGDTFWNFDDVKPGDHGINVISLHAYNNDAYACLIANHIVDAEETVVDPEIAAGDTIQSVVGELSQFIKFFAWEDDNDGVYEGEPIIANLNSPFATAIGEISLTESNTKYVGLAWCAGTQGLTDNTITCDGSSMDDIAQTDILTAYFTAYAEQQRNNGDFDCANVELP